MIHCLIPAKANSTRIKHKNLKTFLGEPIINFVINKCLHDDIFKKVDVFTNSDVIRNKVYIFGDRVNIIKEDDNLKESRTTSDVVLDYIKSKKLKSGKIALIYPTSVFITSRDIKNILGINTNKTVVACKKIDKKVFNSYLDGKRISTKYKNKISQDIPAPYVDAGQFYLIDIESFLKDPVILADEIEVYKLEYESIDIDSPEDWYKAEELFSKQIRV